MRLIQISLTLLFIGVQFIAKAQQYEQDVLGEGFLKATINQPDDYEGKVTCTVIKKMPEKPSRMAVLYIHGFNDYFFQKEMAGKYEEQGFSFYALDLRKYGRSYLPNQKFNNVRDLSEYFLDIDTTLKIMKKEGAEKILLCGHSTGGLIVTLYANNRTGRELFDAIFLNSPFFDMNLSRFVEKNILPSIARKGEKKPDKLMKGGLTKWYGYSLHQSEKGEWDYNLTWKPHTPPSVNYGWIKAIRDGQLKVQAGISIGKPVLVMHSNKSVYTKKWTDKLFEGDAVLSVEDIANYAKKLKGNITVKVIENGMHDLVLSRPAVRQTVYKELFLWTRNNI